jgi:hypothetical protein
MSDGVFGVLGGMALANLDRANNQTARHNEELAGMMEYQGNVADATLAEVRKIMTWVKATNEAANRSTQQGGLNMSAIERNVREIRATAGKVDGVMAVADQTKAVVDDTNEGVKATFDVTKEARNNTNRLLSLVTDMHQSQTMMIDVLERVIKRDEALEKEVHELRDLVARSNGPSPD